MEEVLHHLGCILKPRKSWDFSSQPQPGEVFSRKILVAINSNSATFRVSFGSRPTATLHMANPLRVKVGSAIIGPKGAHVQQLKEVLHGINGGGWL